MNAIQRDHPDIAVYTPAEIAAHCLAVLLNLALQAASLVWLWRHRERLLDVYFLVPVAVCVGVFVADLVSGLLHWGLDTWFDADTPVLSRMVKTVREHHIFPSHVLNYKLRHHVGVLSAPALLLMAVAMSLIWGSDFEPRYEVLLAVSSLVVASFGVVFMFETHKVGHRRARSKFAQILGRYHLLITPEHHMAHHRAPRDFNYCLVTGWADWWMSRADGWRRLERLITRVTGAVPRLDDRSWCERYSTRND